MKKIYTTTLFLLISCLLIQAGCSRSSQESEEARLAKSVESKLSNDMPAQYEQGMVQKVEAKIDIKSEHVDNGDSEGNVVVYDPSAAAPGNNRQVRAQTERKFRLQDEQNTVDIFSAAAPQTVFVTQNRVVQSLWAEDREVPAGTGSGFIWDKSGHIVTNYHVVEGGSTINVTLYNHRTYPARVVGVEPRKDIAVLKIDAPSGELSPIRIPEEGYEIAVGQKAIAIGNPFGLDHTLTVGIVSAVGRERPGIGGVTIRDMIQTDASINMGNSGGPLLDSDGSLIGMNTMIYSRSGGSDGIGFAIPVSVIRRIVPQIIRTGKAQQIGLGVTILSDSIARQNGVKGVIIRNVGANTPAAKAGLKGVTVTASGAAIGDVIIGIDERPVVNYDDLYNELDRHKAGDHVKVKILRDRQVQTVDVEVYVLPE